MFWKPVSSFGKAFCSFVVWRGLISKKWCTPVYSIINNIKIVTFYVIEIWQTSSLKFRERFHLGLRLWLSLKKKLCDLLRIKTLPGAGMLLIAALFIFSQVSSYTNIQYTNKKYIYKKNILNNINHGLTATYCTTYCSDWWSFIFLTLVITYMLQIHLNVNIYSILCIFSNPYCKNPILFVRHNNLFMTRKQKYWLFSSSVI